MVSKKILVVDDEEAIREVMKMGLVKLGYDPVFAENGKEAFEILTREKFPLILMDIRLPGMDGIEFLKKVKQRSPGTVGMIMSGFVKPEAVSNAMNRGVVNRFKEKPLDINEIKQAVAIANTRYKIDVECRRERMSLIQPRRVFSFQ